eukprot:g1027.t1
MGSNASTEPIVGTPRPCLERAIVCKWEHGKLGASGYADRNDELHAAARVLAAAFGQTAFLLAEMAPEPVSALFEYLPSGRGCGHASRRELKQLAEDVAAAFGRVQALCDRIAELQQTRVPAEERIIYTYKYTGGSLGNCPRKELENLYDAAVGSHVLIFNEETRTWERGTLTEKMEGRDHRWRVTIPVIVDGGGGGGSRSFIPDFAFIAKNHGNGGIQK